MTIFVKKRFTEVRSRMIYHALKGVWGALPPTSKEHVGYPHALLAKIIVRIKSLNYH